MVCEGAIHGYTTVTFAGLYVTDVGAIAPGLNKTLENAPVMPMCVIGMSDDPEAGVNPEASSMLRLPFKLELAPKTRSWVMVAAAVALTFKVAVLVCVNP